MTLFSNFWEFCRNYYAICISFWSFVFTRYSSYILRCGEKLLHEISRNVILFINVKKFHKSVTVLFDRVIARFYVAFSTHGANFLAGKVVWYLLLTDFAANYCEQVIWPLLCAIQPIFVLVYITRCLSGTILYTWKISRMVIGHRSSSR